VLHKISDQNYSAASIAVPKELYFSLLAIIGPRRLKMTIFKSVEIMCSALYAALKNPELEITLNTRVNLLCSFIFSARCVGIRS